MGKTRVRISQVYLNYFYGLSQFQFKNEIDCLHLKMPQQGSLTQEMELADEPWTGERRVDSFWKMLSANYICRVATPGRDLCCAKRVRWKRGGSCSKQFLIMWGHRPKFIPVRFTACQALCWPVSSPCHTQRYMTFKVTSWCFMDLWPKARPTCSCLYSLLPTWEIQNRKETNGNKTI